LVFGSFRQFCVGCLCLRSPCRVLNNHFHRSPKDIQQAELILTTIKTSNPELVITTEGKDPNICWAQLGLTFMHRWTNMLKTSGRWSIHDVDPKMVLRLHFNNSLPIFLWEGDDFFNLENIPTATATIKKKCYSEKNRAIQFCGQYYPGAITKTCTKPGHSCMRNVCSFYNFPGQNKYRAVSRCLHYLCRQLLSSWAITNLSQSADCFAESVEALTKNPTRTCCACKASMDAPSIVIRCCTSLRTCKT